MKEDTKFSISFVITMIYTYTFGSAVYRVFEIKEAILGITLREGITWINIVFMVVCITMALRFFFGNNSYVGHLFTTHLAPWKRLYHLTVIVMQSLILLGSSHLIANPRDFLFWIAALFATEVGWYIGCIVFLQDAIKRGDKLNRSLFVNEIVNYAMAVMACLAAIFWTSHPMSMALAFTVMFVVNTLVDLKTNLHAYMGEGTVAT